MSESRVDCLSPAGRKIATLRITPASDATTISHDFSGKVMQLHENGRYWCELIASDARDAHLQCSLFRMRVPGPRETWLMEVGSNAGNLRIDLLDSKHLRLGTAWLEVMSLKLHEREHYRVMLNDIGERMAGLLHNLRASSTMPLATAWRNEPAALQQQLAFLCEAIETPAFHHALQHILDAPHRALQREPAIQSLSRPFKQDASFARQLASANPRVPVPASHSAAYPLRSVPARITTAQHIDEFDTPENQFVLFALSRMREFLHHAASALRANGADWHVPAQRAEQCEHALAQWLSRSFFDTISPLRTFPWNSTALQRKAGYREVLQTWLRFQAQSQLDWDAAGDLFHAGKRDTAQLYEFWLFFQLLDAFCASFNVEQPPARSLIERSANGWWLRLKQGHASAPIIGIARGVIALFQYNRAFAAPAESWTQSMRPDFTFTFWPAGMTQAEAAERSRLMHLHFDAKYRVDKPADVLDARGANRDDLLKMHAYRDAIRHTAGAYVLYPGRGEPALMSREDDRLPSLGAFGVMPAAGNAQGMAQVSAFITDATNALKAG